MKYLNALAMLLQFISFWLAAPEIIGDSKLKLLNNFFKNLVSKLSIIILAGFILAFSLTVSINGIITGIEASEKGIEKSEMLKYYLIIGIATIFYIFFMIQFKRIRKWMDDNIAAPLVNKFTYNEGFRRNSLVAGAILFTFGFLIQFIILLLQP